jgi:hypothetical protein
VGWFFLLPISLAFSSFTREEVTSSAGITCRLAWVEPVGRTGGAKKSVCFVLGKFATGHRYFLVFVETHHPIMYLPGIITIL